MVQGINLRQGLGDHPLIKLEEELLNRLHTFWPEVAGTS